MIGKTIQQYLVKKKLGNGAMGSVYLATDIALDRPVALKFIMSDFGDHPEMARRFLAEARVLANLSSLNIPILYGYFISDGHGVMAMEYVDGATLEELVMQRGPIPAEVCVPWIRQALRGLAAAHRVGVIHRDLKPSNLMLNQQGTVKVVDFGIAKKIEDDAGLTATNTTLGTPFYMAPEQIMGKPVTPPTDVYSMGVVLYQLLAGVVPFHATSIYAIQNHHLQTLPDPPTIHYPHIPPEVVKAVLKALEKDPSNRFNSADEFLHALPDYHSISDTAPIAVPPRPIKPAPSQPVSPVETKKPQPAPNSTPGSVPSPASASLQSVSSAPAHLPPSPPPQRNWPVIGGLAAGLVVVAGGGGYYALHANSARPEPAPIAVISQLPPLHNTGDPLGSLSGPEPPKGGNEAPPSAGGSPNGGTSRSGGRKVNGDKSATDPGSKSKTPLTPPPEPDLSHVQPLPAHVEGQELSGSWRGAYTDSKSPQEKTSVTIQLQELNGSTVSGTISFVRADHISGTCTLGSSIYQANTGTLRLLPHCPDLAVAPGYLNTPTTIKVSDPAEHTLTGHILGYPTVKVDITR